MSDSDSEPKKLAKKKTGKGVGTGRGRLTDAERRMRDIEILKLRQQGVTLDEIAPIVGLCDASSVHDALVRILNSHRALQVEDFRSFQLGQLDEWMQVLRPYLVAGYETAVPEDPKITSIRMDKQLGAVDRAIKLQERAAKIMGSDQPLKQEVSGPDGATPFVVQLGWPTPDPNTEVVNQDDLKNE